MTVDIRALIFDMDGVIADTIDLHYRAWQRLAQEEQITFSPEQYRQMQGITRPEALKIFLNGRTLNDSAAQAWMNRKNGYFLELLEHTTDAHSKPGAAELIGEARTNGIKIGLGSSSQNAHLVLRKLALIDLFDVIADGTTVDSNKPAPDIFLWVAAQLGVKPAQGVVFEDSEAGIQAASKGGFWVVGIGKDYDSQPHLALQSLAEIDLDALRQHLISFKTP
jgi:beta-phosphoglucomutase